MSKRRSISTDGRGMLKQKCHMMNHKRFGEGCDFYDCWLCYNRRILQDIKKRKHIQTRREDMRNESE